MGDFVRDILLEQVCDITTTGKLDGVCSFYRARQVIHRQVLVQHCTIASDAG